jgi:ABC-2 type transport system ATP-binding protein
MLMDIIRPDSGSILYDGQPLTSGIKDRITYLPEERGLYRKEKVHDILEYFAVLKGLTRKESRAQALVYLEKLEMKDVSGKRIEELSKGNQQKIQIASTLVSNPDVLILDEPFSGLDPINVRLSKNLLLEQKVQGKTILLSTHQMNQVEELCDMLLMIHHGRKVLYGPVTEIVERYSEPALLVDCGDLDGEIPGVERAVRQGSRWKITLKPGVSASSILKSLIDRGIVIEQFQRARTPLEEIFVKVAREAGEETRA